MEAEHRADHVQVIEDASIRFGWRSVQPVFSQSISLTPVALTAQLVLSSERRMDRTAREPSPARLVALNFAMRCWTQFTARLFGDCEVSFLQLKGVLLLRLILVLSQILLGLPLWPPQRPVPQVHNQSSSPPSL